MGPGAGAGTFGVPGVPTGPVWLRTCRHSTAPTEPAAPAAQTMSGLPGVKAAGPTAQCLGATAQDCLLLGGQTGNAHHHWVRLGMQSQG